MASSAQEHLPIPYGATTAPPPTPCTQTTGVSSDAAADTLSRLLHRLPPSLSLPTRLSPRTKPAPIIPFSPQNPGFLTPHLSSFSQLGFFQLTNHQLAPQLAHAAESESLSLFKLSKTEKQQSFSNTWPLGYDDGDDEQERSAESFCLDSSCSSESNESTESTQVSLSSLQEFTRELEKVGLQIVEAISCALGFDRALKEKEALLPSSLMWISEGVAGNKQSGRFYPYIVALQYQIRCVKYSLLTDSGWMTVSPQVDSVLVTIGDIAQVWSNGRLKKVRGRPMAISDNNDDSRCCITMALLVTPPTGTPVAISPFSSMNDCHGNDNSDDKDEEEEEKLGFDAFSFEDYAWRIYHERFLFKDPLDRYRSH